MGWDGPGRGGRGAGINGPADKIISEAMLKKGSLAAPRAIHSPLSLLSPAPRKSKTTPARNGSSLSLSLWKLINELDSAPCKFVASVKCKV